MKDFGKINESFDVMPSERPQYFQMKTKNKTKIKDIRLTDSVQMTSISRNQVEETEKKRMKLEEEIMKGILA